MRPLNSIKTAPPLRSYVAPWKGEIVLVCKRCQKRLRKSHRPPPFKRVKKWLRAKLREDTPETKFHIIEIPCQKICPKNGIVICGGSQLRANPVRLSVIYNGSQMRKFFATLVR
jgi:hypothetical protein